MGDRLHRWKTGQGKSKGKSKKKKVDPQAGKQGGLVGKKYGNEKGFQGNNKKRSPDQPRARKLVAPSPKNTTKRSTQLKGKKGSRE